MKICSQDIGMEFGIGKTCHANNKKAENGKNQEKIRTLGENETYLGISEVATIQHAEMKEKN